MTKIYCFYVFPYNFFFFWWLSQKDVDNVRNSNLSSACNGIHLKKNLNSSVKKNNLTGQCLLENADNFKSRKNSNKPEIES